MQQSNQFYGAGRVLSFLGLLALFFLFSCPGMDNAQAEVVDRIAAKVNGEIITLYELNEAAKPYLKQFQGRSLGPAEKKSILDLKHKILNSMIEDKLLAAEAQRLGIEITSSEVENEIRSFRRKNELSESELREQLRVQGMSMQEFEAKMKRDILRHRLLGFMVQRKVVITEEELLEYYENHASEFSAQKTVTMRIIVLQDEKTAQSVVSGLQSGEYDFAQAALRYSQGPGAEKGGLLEPVSWSELGEEWRNALSGMHAGEISSPFSVGGNIALVKLEKMTSGETLPFEEVQEEIREQLYRPRVEARFEEYMEGLKSKALIEILL